MNRKIRQLFTLTRTSGGTLAHNSTRAAAHRWGTLQHTDEYVFKQWVSEWVNDEGSYEKMRRLKEMKGKKWKINRKNIMTLWKADNMSKENNAYL